MPAPLTERHWWAILLIAEVQATHGDINAHAVSIRARYALVKQFGLNLDTIDDRAREEYAQLMDDQAEKVRVEKENWEKTKQLLDKLGG